MRGFAVCALLLLVVFAAGCSSPESNVVGVWASKTGSIEFFKDKSGVINPPQGEPDLPKNVKFQWSIEGEDVVNMTLEPPISKVVKAKLDGKKVLIVEEDRFVKQ